MSVSRVFKPCSSKFRVYLSKLVDRLVEAWFSYKLSASCSTETRLDEENPDPSQSHIQAPSAHPKCLVSHDPRLCYNTLQSSQSHTKFAHHCTHRCRPPERSHELPDLPPPFPSALKVVFITTSDSPIRPVLLDHILHGVGSTVSDQVDETMMSILCVSDARMDDGHTSRHQPLGSLGYRVWVICHGRAVSHMRPYARTSPPTIGKARAWYENDGVIRCSACSVQLR